MCMASPSRSVKSNSVLYMIVLLSKGFTEILIATKTNETPSDHLKDTIDNIHEIEEGMISAIAEYDSATSNLVIFDELVMKPERTQAQNSKYFIRGR